jgi:hypothetical protein
MFGRKIKFSDKFGNKFWIYPKEDALKTYRKRASVTDAINIINYIKKNVNSIDVGIDLGANLGAVSIEMWKKNQK